MRIYTLVLLSYLALCLCPVSTSKSKYREADLLKLIRQLREEGAGGMKEQKRQNTCPPEYQKLRTESGVTQTMCKPTNPAATNAGISAADKEKIVDFHNKIRSEVQPPAANMQKIKWDSEVARVAQHYTETCPNWHDQNDERLSPEYGLRVWIGQNIAQGMPDWDYVLNAWYNESQWYRYGPGGSRNMMSQGHSVGHYTQQTWAVTSLIGCGYAECPGVMPFQQYTDKNMFACNFVWGQSWDVTEPYKQGYVMGEDCPENRDEHGLCDCNGLVCEDKEKTDVSTCTCLTENSVKKRFLEFLLNNHLRTSD